MSRAAIEALATIDRMISHPDALARPIANHLTRLLVPIREAVLGAEHLRPETLTRTDLLTALAAVSNIARVQYLAVHDSLVEARLLAKAEVCEELIDLLKGES